MKRATGRVLARDEETRPASAILAAHFHTRYTVFQNRLPIILNYDWTIIINRLNESLKGTVVKV